VKAVKCWPIDKIIRR